jgi:hypothetical protein
MSEDATDALAGYPLSQLEEVGAFLAGQYRRDAVGAMLGGGGDDDGGGVDEGRDGGGASPTAAPAGGGMLELVLAVLGGRAAAGAGDSTAGSPGATAADGGGDSLGRLLGGVQRACRAALGGTAEVVSPTLRLASSLALGPPPTALAAAYLGSTAVVAAAWEGQPLVLLARGEEGGLGQGGAAAEPGLQGALVRLPPGTRAVDLAVYREGQLALLLGPAGGDEQQPGGGACHLLLLPPERLRFEPLPGALRPEGQRGAAAEQALPEGCRRRLLPYPRVQAPLAVSASRGVGCVLAGTQVGGGGDWLGGGGGVCVCGVCGGARVRGWPWTLGQHS